MKIDQEGIDLIARWEGLENEAYPDPATGGEPWTIGIGHTSAAGEPHVYKGLYVTDQEAHEIFKRDVVQYEDTVNRVCPGPTTQHQFNAMVSLCYNIGGGNFDGSSVDRYHNEKNYPEAAESFLLWNKANGQVMQGLVNRREDEKKHYEMQDTVAPPEPIDPDEITTPPETGEHPPQPPTPAGVVFEYAVVEIAEPIEELLNVWGGGGWRLVQIAPGKKLVWERRIR